MKCYEVKNFLLRFPRNHFKASQTGESIAGGLELTWEYPLTSFLTRTVFVN